MKKRYYTQDTNWAEETEPFLNLAKKSEIEIAIKFISKRVEDETERRDALEDMESSSDCPVFFYDEKELVDFIGVLNKFKI